MPRSSRRSSQVAATLKLKPADPFELVRWLAQSQSDPRKATAELVQNSLDAQARHVTVRRQRVRGAVCLIVRDDGEGVVPELSREEALRYLATHVGHSRKRGLDPAERARQVVAGQYGVGLLGFWSIGKRLELRTRVNDSPVMGLRLEQDSPSAQIVSLPATIGSPPTFTEVVVGQVHETALKALSGRRLADYLASELRGQILQHGARVTVRDDIARGPAQKFFPVVPKRFSGEPLSVPHEVPVEGYGPLRVEIYLARGAERPTIQIACAGTVVADDIAELSALDLARPPWVGRELSGVIDFPGFRVPPGTRRGVMPDVAATAFVEALDRLEPLVLRELERLDTERRETLDRNVVRELRRALRGLDRRLPHYDLPRVGTPDGPKDGAGPGEPERESDAHPTEAEEPAGEPELPLLPPGPLASVRLVPEAIEVAPGATRRVRAACTDVNGRLLEGVEMAWHLDPCAGLSIHEAAGTVAQVAASPEARVGAASTLHVTARGAPGATLDASALVSVTASRDDGSDLGIPEPQLLSDPEGRWRSRMFEARWEVNDEHDDYRAVRTDPRLRLRYLLSLLAKEIVVRSSGRPELGEVLESMVEILAHAERNLQK